MNKEVITYYKERVKKSQRDDFLWQVGKTVNGQKVSRKQINLIIKTILKKLKISENDLVLDIGSGNGLLTREISKFVTKIIGVELTTELYEIAKDYNSSNNISYNNYNILEPEFNENIQKYSKIYMYELIQHMNYKEADKLFTNLKKISNTNSLIFIGGILDIEKKWSFFNTIERKCKYFSDLISGSDPLGTWYYKDFFYCLAKKHGFQVECSAQDENLYTSHYRFDCLLKNK